MAEERPATVEEIITGLAKQQGVSPALALAVAKKESNFKTSAIGDSGQAVGTFQLHEGAATDTGVDRADPIQNITGGIKYLKQLSDRYKGDVQKTLMAYNGGMESVDAGTPSPAAQAYAADVLANLSAGLRPTPAGPAGATKPTFTDESVPITPTQKPPTYRERVRQIFQASPEGQMLEAAKGAGKSAAKRATDLYAMVQKRLNIPSILPPVGSPSFSTDLTNRAQKLGAGLEQVGEFAAASELTGGLGGGLLVQAPAQAAAAYGVSKAQGASETGSRVNAAFGAIGPVISEAMPLLGNAIRERAVKQLALRLTKGLAEPSPAIEYGLKTGDVAPVAQDAVKIVRQAAGDILDAPVQMTWGKWLASLSKDEAQKGKNLGTALASPLGDVMLFKQPIYDELDKLVQQSAQHLANIPSPGGGGLGGGVKAVTYNPDLLKAVDALKETLDQYAPMISVRNLSDLKRSWDDIVYTLSTSGKVGLGSEALLNNAKKKVAAIGANTIRQVFDQKAPTIDALNEAASNAYRLQDLVQKVFTKQPGMGVAGKVVAGTAGSVGGFVLGQTVGHPYVVMGMGAAASRALVKALESPAFQTLSPSLKNELAYAIATGKAETVRRILAPIVSTTVSQESQPAGVAP